MIQEFLMELINIARASEIPQYTEYWLWPTFVIGNVLMFVPSFNWPSLPKKQTKNGMRECVNKEMNNHGGVYHE